MDEEVLYDVGLFLAYASLGASSFVGAKAGLPYFPPLLFGALRLDLGAVLMVGYVYARRTYWLPKTRTDVVCTMITGIFTVGLAIPLLYLGQQHVTSGVGAVVYSLTPILTGVAAIGLLSSVRLGFTDIIGFVLGLVGVAVVAGVDPGQLITSDVRGVALIFGSAFVFALGNVVVQRIRPTLPSVTLTSWGLVLAAITSHAMSLATGESPAAIQWTTQAWIALVVTGIFASALYYGIHFELVRRIGSTRTNLVYYLMPVSATFAGWLLLNEQLTLTTGIGFGMIFVGFVSLEYQSLFAVMQENSTPD